MRWIGVCERAFELLCRHAATRELAPGRPLGAKQMVQQWIAESRAEIHAARLMVLHAAWRIEREGAAAAREEISLIKFSVARTMQRVLDRAIQAHGGAGHDRRHAARLLVRARARRAHLRRRRRGAPRGGGAPHPAPLRDEGAVSAGGGAVRPGEELDDAAVDAWLKARVPGLPARRGSPSTRAAPRTGPTGLEYESHDLVLRRPPAGTKAQVGARHGPRVPGPAGARPACSRTCPEMIAFCDDPAVLGCDFYVMRRIPGLILRASLPRGLTLDAAAARALVPRACSTGWSSCTASTRARSGSSRLGRGAGYARRQVEGWSDRYRQARTWNVPRFERVMAWLAEHTPEDVRTCVIHNDFRLDNVVLDADDPTRIVGILDWEMATLGDPLMDLGNSLAYWVRGRRRLRSCARSAASPPTCPACSTRREVVEHYCERSGLRPADWTFYEVYGLFRLAVIAQQIYFRYHHRQTRNPAFRRFWLIAHYLEWRCRRRIRRSSS